MKNRFFVLCLLIVWLVGCQGQTPATPTATLAVATATQLAMEVAATEAVPATSTIVPTATVPPTATMLPTATTLPTPTLEPTIPPVVRDLPNVELPPGFSFIKYADMYRPTSLAFDTAGNLYATSVDTTIHVFSDLDGNGRSDRDIIFSNGFNTPLGITVHPHTGDVYVSSNQKISVLRDTDGDLVADEAVNFVNNLPIGLHQNDNLKFGPDGLLYIGIGSTCDACVETDPRSATIMRFDINTKQGEVFATGMRNPYDLAFHPVTGDLFATDNGRDDLGMDAPQEELNHIVQGGDYGWPDCWDEGVGSGCAGTKTAVAFFESHSSADSLTFYTGNRFPADYQHNAFVSILGSWLKSGVKTGVARVILTPDGDGYRSEVSWFASWGGMPLGLTEGSDGALYVGDYINGGIYRISYGN